MPEPASGYVAGVRLRAAGIQSLGARLGSAEMADGTAPVARGSATSCCNEGRLHNKSWPVKFLARPLAAALLAASVALSPLLARAAEPVRFGYVMTTGTEGTGEGPFSTWRI
jgi:hypothetical protein